MRCPIRAVPTSYALFAHCFTCTKDIFAARYVTKGLAERGIAVLRFDFTGIGASEGEFANTNFSSNVEDLKKAAAYLAAEHEPPQLLVGHSLGGAAVLAAAGEIESVKAVVTIGAPAEPAHVSHLFTGSKEIIETEGEAEVLLAGRPFKIKKQFLEDIEANKLADKISSLGKALLIFHSEVDATVGIDNARQIFLAAQHPKSFVSLDRADHLLSDRRDALYVADVLASWVSRYVGTSDDTDSGEADTGDDRSVMVAESGGSGFAQSISTGKHELVADEPSAMGGGNAGPSPYGFLLAALGSCTTMTLRMYASRKGIPLKKASVELRHTKVHKEDCEGCADGAGAKVDLIERTIHLEGDLSDEQRAELMAVADKCPVHRTLTAAVEVKTTLGD